MSRTFFLSVFLFACLPVFADRQAETGMIREFLRQNDVKAEEVSDTLLIYQGYPVRIVQEKDSIIHIGLDLFNPEFKNAGNEDLLNFIERDLFLQLIWDEKKEDSVIDFHIGSLPELKKITAETPCNISIQDGTRLWMDWALDDGSNILISAPVSYDLIMGATRSEIEKTFISRLRQSNTRKSADPDINIADLQPYGEAEYVLPGDTYINRQITRNKYLYGDKQPSLIWDASHPVESLSNMFICGAGHGDTSLDVTIMKHDYGEKEEVETSVENLLAVAEKEGCEPYWGLESFEDGIIRGSLFLYNPVQGYDHVFKIECVAEEIIEGNGKIKAKAYLYIPSNNVSNLNEPYRVKSEDEKIKYWEN